MTTGTRHPHSVAHVRDVAARRYRPTVQSRAASRAQKGLPTPKGGSEGASLGYGERVGGVGHGRDFSAGADRNVSILQRWPARLQRWHPA